MYTAIERLNMSNHIVTIHDAQTGEIVVRELTAEEIAELPEAFFVEEKSVVDDLVEGEQP